MILDTIHVKTGLNIPHLFISDCHMLDGSLAEDFKATAFEKFLGTVPPEWHIVGLGDILELAQGDIWAILHMRWPLIKQLIDRGAEFVAGNHDWLLNSCMSVSSLWLGGRIIAEHGHLADPLAARPSWLRNIGLRIVGILERLGWQVDEDWRKLAARWGRRNGRGTPNDEYYDRAHTLCNWGHQAIYIFGHTHSPEFALHDGLIIANCGDWLMHNTAIVATPDVLHLIKGEVPAQLRG